MTHAELLNRVVANPQVCGGRPCIRGTRLEISIILDSLAEGATLEEVIDHHPQLSRDDISAALAYAAELSRENLWKISPEQ